MIESVNVKYASDGTNFTGSVVAGLAFDEAATTKSTQWSVPETPVGAGYKILVEDANYKKSGVAGTYVISDAFKVKGVIDITVPVNPDTWPVTETKRINWNIVHGEIANVKIIASPSGNFSGDEYTIIAQTDADNDVAFNALSSPVAKGYYDWPIP
jgi:hypothetical protein